MGKSAFAAECCICLVTFEPGMRVDVLACHPTHMFHEECYNYFVSEEEKKGNRLVCPLCRQPVDKTKTKKTVLASKAGEIEDPFALEKEN